MTPEEKAKYLFDHYHHYVGGGVFGQCHECQQVGLRHCAHPEECGFSEIISLAKKCALICCDEIISEVKGIPESSDGWSVGSIIEYWQQVKQEIEKL